MKTFKKRISVSGQIASTSLPVDSPVSRSRSQENAKGQKTTAIYGPQCSTLFELFDPAGSWQRTFSELLIGRKDWYSTRCALTWKRTATKYNRSLFRACGVGAPHRRDRIWFIAHRTDTRLEALRERSNEVHANRLASDSPCLGRITRRSKSNRTIQEEKIGSNIYVPIERSGSKRTFTNPNSERCCQFVDSTFANRQGQSCRNSYAGDASDTKGKRFPERNGQPSRDGSYSTAQRHNCIPDWKNFPAQSPVCGRNDGLSDLLDPAAVFAKSVIDRHRNPVPRWRIEAIKCYGNAIVPQVAYRVLHTIRNYINAQLQ